MSSDHIKIVALTADHADTFLGLVDALADYEHLDRPSDEARMRLLRDGLGASPRFEAYLAFIDDTAVGYAITFETYSSFLALPTMYLEDLFVVEGARKQGAGNALFDHVSREAVRRGCGRMEWTVLDWNMLARDFYARKHAVYLKEWLLYRITL